MAAVRASVLAFLSLLLTGSCVTDPRGAGVRLLAEWEARLEVFVGFRTWETDSAYDHISVRMACDLSRFHKVTLLVEDSALLPVDKRFLHTGGADTLQIRFLVESPTYFWIRDPGPLFYQDQTGQTGIADFRFTYYTGLCPDSIPEEHIPLDRYDRLFAERFRYPVVSSNLVVEGGGFETNGDGTVILVEPLFLHRNPGWTKARTEGELRQLYGVQTVIWLPDGLAEDPYYMGHLYQDFFGFGTGGHSDTFVRFVNDSTIFLAWMEDDPDPDFPLRAENQRRMQANYEILSQARDHHGRGFTVVLVPQPVLFYQTRVLDEDTRIFLTDQHPELNLTREQPIHIVASAGYLNFVMTDRIILLPAYWDPSVPAQQKERDMKVLRIFESWCPDQHIVQINPLSLNFAGGGMHCMTFCRPLASGE